MPTSSSQAVLTKKLGRSGPRESTAGPSRESRVDMDDGGLGDGGRDGGRGDGGYGDDGRGGRWTRGRGRGKGRGKNSGWWVSSGTGSCHSTFCPCNPRSLIWFIIGFLLGALLMGLILGLCIALGAFDFVEQTEVICIPNSTIPYQYTTLGTPVTSP